jgi:hypothetical protein
MSSLIDEDKQMNSTTRVADVKVDALFKLALPDGLLTLDILAALLKSDLRVVEPDVALSVASVTSVGSLSSPSCNTFP